MNFVKSFSIKERIKEEIRASKKVGALVRALLFLIFDLCIMFLSASLSFFPIRLAGRLMQKLY